MKNKKQDNISGFTIVELTVVIAIIGILAVISLPQFVKINNSMLLRTAYEKAKDDITSPPGGDVWELVTVSIKEI